MKQHKPLNAQTLILGLLATFCITVQAQNDELIDVEFYNATSPRATVEVYWVNDEGTETLYHTMTAETEPVTQASYVGHEWRFKQGNRVLGEYVVSGSSDGQRVMIGRAAAPAPAPAPGSPPPPPRPGTAPAEPFVSPGMRAMMNVETTGVFLAIDVEEGEVAGLRQVNQAGNGLQIVFQGDPDTVTAHATSLPIVFNLGTPDSEETLRFVSGGKRATLGPGVEAWHRCEGTAKVALDNDTGQPLWIYRAPVLNYGAEEIPREYLVQILPASESMELDVPNGTLLYGSPVEGGAGTRWVLPVHESQRFVLQGNPVSF